jgi:outer membrane protein OmpA-like peptidoglycan-associated protein
MKTISLILLFTTSFLFLSMQEADAQFLKGVRKKAVHKVEHAAARKAEDKAAALATKEMEKLLNSKLNLFETGTSKEGISGLPKEYSFNWKYQMEIQDPFGENKDAVYNFYLSSGHRYFAYGAPEKSNALVVIDPDNHVMVSYMDKKGHHQAMAFDLPSASFGEAGDQAAASFTKTKLPQKRFLGYEAEGVQYENKEHKVIDYYTTKLNVTFMGILASNKIALPGDAKGAVKKQNALPLYVKYIDKSSKNSGVMKGKKLEKIKLKKVNSKYTFLKAPGKEGQTAPQQPAAASAAVTTGSSMEGSASAAPATAAVASYKNYDFVPGDNIIFQTNFAQQQNAELPARLGTLSGTAEIQTYKGDKVLHLEKGDGVSLIPIMDKKNYLPGQFTIEFDLLYNAPDPGSFNTFSVHFYKADKTQEDLKYNEGDYHFLIYEAYHIDFGPTISGKDVNQEVINALKVPDVWHHFAIYVHNNVGKLYIDQYRVAASNMMPKGAVKLVIKTDGRMEYMIKNVRVAGGGSDAYNKIMTEGKLVTHGIHFASGKSDILPESMGTINEVYKIMQNHSDLKFEIDGYTDNIGAADYNLKLSQQRADAVKKQLLNMGVDLSRLTTKGFGETKPMDKNDTPEGRANNRRVEFVKM